jgi:hypothetical protein
MRLAPSMSKVARERRGIVVQLLAMVVLPQAACRRGRPDDRWERPRRFRPHNAIENAGRIRQRRSRRSAAVYRLSIPGDLNFVCAARI